MNNYSEPTVLYEDNHLLVVLKPQNLGSCPDESGDENMLDLLKEYLRRKYDKKGNVFLGLVHRLDRPTGGLMVFAKTSKAASRLAEQMKKGDFEKRYLAVLVGTPHEESGRLTNWLKKSDVNNTVYLSTQGAVGAKLAVLDYRILETKDGLSLAEIKLHTGRSHQIRVQMAGISHPVYGDLRYGGERAQKGKLALWAYSLAFFHPVEGFRMQFAADPAAGSAPSQRCRLRFLSEPPADEAPWNRFDVASAVKPY